MKKASCFILLIFVPVYAILLLVLRIKYEQLSTAFIISGFAFLSIIVIVALLFFPGKEQNGIRKLKIQTLDKTISEFENIAYQNNSCMIDEKQDKSRDNKQKNSRSITEQDKEIFKAFANAIADL